MSRRYQACLHPVDNRGEPPKEFLDELTDWASTASDDIFEESTRHDIYSELEDVLGPWQGLQHRKAAMVEVLRVLAGFESSWDWNEGRDTTNPASNTPCTTEAGIFQCSGDSMEHSRALRQLLKSTAGSDDCATFQATTKKDHVFALEYCARLLRITTGHHGPIKDGSLKRAVRRDAVAEFQTFF